MGFYVCSFMVLVENLACADDLGFRKRNSLCKELMRNNVGKRGFGLALCLSLK